MLNISRHRAARRAASPLVAGLMAVIPAGSAALARDTDLTGHWIGKWNGTFFVEYVVTRADRKSLTGNYGFMPDGQHETLSPIVCRATGAYAYNCGATQVTFTSTTTADAVMHRPNGETLTTELTR